MISPSRSSVLPITDRSFAVTAMLVENTVQNVYCCLMSPLTTAS